VLAIAGVAAAAVLLFALPLGIVLGRSAHDRELLRLQRDTVAATRQIDVAPGSTDPIELPSTGDVLGVYDPTGRRVAGRGPARADALVLAALRSGKPGGASGNGTLEAAVPLVVDERISGAVRAARPDTVAARDARKAWLAIGGLAAGLAVAAVVAATALARRLARPLERLAVAARRLGDGDFSVRAPRSAIGEVDALAAALDATAARLDDLLTRERAFSAQASHQLRTPLAALRIELEAMQLRGERAPELEAALTQADRLEATIETLLAIARDAPGRGTTSDLGKLLADVDERWRGPLARLGRPLRVGSPRAVARAAPGAVAEVLEVLLSNAATHGRGAVTVDVRSLDGWVAIDVADEGSGFASDDGATFDRTERSGDGHGIGLPIARALAEAEGGRLELTRAAPEPVLTLLLRAGRA
jgi:signal transduction histidine kinase